MIKNTPQANNIDKAITLADKSIDLYNATKDKRKIGDVVQVLGNIDHVSASLAKDMIVSTCRIMLKK